MYYMFGFLFLVFIILLITCSEATVLLCYFHLCAEVRECSEKLSSFIKLVNVCYLVFVYLSILSNTFAINSLIYIFIMLTHKKKAPWVTIRRQKCNINPKVKWSLQKYLPLDHAPKCLNPRAHIIQSQDCNVLRICKTIHIFVQIPVSISKAYFRFSHNFSHVSRTTTGGGVPSWPVASQQSICSSMLCITSSQNFK